MTSDNLHTHACMHLPHTYARVQVGMRLCRKGRARIQLSVTVAERRRQPQGHVLPSCPAVMAQATKCGF